MALVEVIRPLTAADETIDAARTFAKACGKTPVDVADAAGFIVNAILFPYVNRPFACSRRASPPPRTSTRP